MSVRTIPKNYRNLTGLAPSEKSNDAFFESTLERDFLTLIEFEQNIQSYEVQPVQIKWWDEDGKQRKYIPDVLIQYFPNQCSYSSFDTILCEVKYRSDIKKNWDILKPKFKAGIRYAKSRGWRFKLFTESEIRSDYMENARFLLPYYHCQLDESHEALLLDKLRSMRECTVEQLVIAIFKDKWAQAELIHSVWHLVASRRVATDLSLPLTMSSRIWLRS